ncbi:TOM1-like protein 2 [Sergentomyia squamirostris]
MAFFALGGNPFSTQVGQRIEQATDSSLASENWALNMEICDMINESSDAARDAMKAIRKRLQQNAGKNYTVIMYTLTVLETCVKNCGRAFHVLVANKEFIQELVKLIGPKNDPPAVVQEKVLNLIQIWAETFRSQPDLNGVVLVYQELKNKGIEFPATDMEAMAPIYTPQRSVPDGVTQATTVTNSPQHTNVVAVAGTGNIPSPMSLSPEQVAKLQSELDIVTVNMSILGEMLTELKPGQEDPSDHKLLTDLAHTCREMQGRIVELIGKVNHDEITAELLRINDELNNLFLRYSRFEKNRDSKAATPSAILGAAMGVPQASAEEEVAGAAAKDSLIDLSDEAAGGLPKQFSSMGLGDSATKVSQISSISAQSGSVLAPKDVDEFDMLAQSRNVTEQGKGTPQKDPANIKDLNARESDFDEMAAWLDNDDPEASENKTRMTSKEFDRFLAERVAAAENLPSIPSQTGSVGVAAPTNGSAASATPTSAAGSRHSKPRKDEDGLIAL